MYIKSEVLTFFFLLPKNKLPIIRFFRCHALHASGNKCQNCNLLFKGEEKLTVYYHVSLPGIFLFTDLIVSRESVSILVRNKTFQCIKAKTKSVRQKEQ